MDEVSDGQLVEQIYDAMHGTISWQCWLDTLRSQFDGVKFALWGHDLQVNSNLGVIHSGFDDVYMDQWVEYFSGVNAWAPGIARAPIGMPRTAEQLLDREELLGTEYYNDWVRPQENIATGVGITLFSDSNRFFGLTANVRLQDEDARKAAVTAALSRIGPHLSRAFDQSRRLPATGNAEGLERFVDQLPLATIALNRNGRYAYMNGLAAHFISSWGEPKLASNGALTFSDPEAGKLLDRAIRAIRFRTHHGLPHRLPLQLGRENATWRMSVLPSPVNTFGPNRRHPLDVQARPIALLICEASSTHVRGSLASSLAAQFSLTKAETELAILLYSGQTLNAIAQHRAVSVHTVRNQLRTVFAKTRTNKQHQLVRLIADRVGHAQF